MKGNIVSKKIELGFQIAFSFRSLKISKGIKFKKKQNNNEYEPRSLKGDSMYR